MCPEGYPSTVVVTAHGGAVAAVGAVCMSEADGVSVTRVSHGVGGSYTQWQGKPPAHSVYMCKVGGGEWTTVQVWHNEERILTYENGAKGPKGVDFAHDMDIQDRPDGEQSEIWEQIRGDLGL